MALAFLHKIPFINRLTTPKKAKEIVNTSFDEGLKPIFIVVVPYSFSIDKLALINRNLEKYNKRDLRIERAPNLTKIKLLTLNPGSPRNLGLPLDQNYLNSNYKSEEIQNPNNLYRIIDSKLRELKNKQSREVVSSSQDKEANPNKIEPGGENKNRTERNS